MLWMYRFPIRPLPDTPGSVDVPGSFGSRQTHQKCSVSVDHNLYFLWYNTSNVLFISIARNMHFTYIPCCYGNSKLVQK